MEEQNIHKWIQCTLSVSPLPHPHKNDLKRDLVLKIMPEGEFEDKNKKNWKS